MLDPFQFLLVSIAGWMNQPQQQVIEYLREKNRVLHEQLGNRRILFNDDQRRRLAVRAKRLGRKLLAEVATLVTPDTRNTMATTSVDQNARELAKNSRRSWCV